MDKKQKPEQQKANLILRIVGGIIAAAGLLMAIFGFVDISSVSESGEMPRIWLLMLGLPCIAIGGMLLMLSFISKYLLKRAVWYGWTGKDAAFGVRFSGRIVCPAARSRIQISF